MASIYTSLHLRMNLATGVKEARLNVPESDDEDVSSGLTIIEDPELSGFESVTNENAPISHQGIDLQQPIRSHIDDVAESSLFADSVAEVKDHGFNDVDSLLPAMTDLADLSHSFHWGVMLSKDGPLTQKLAGLLLPSTLSLELRSMAALVLGTAIHNNGAALSSAIDHFYNDEWPEGPLEAVILALLYEQSPVLLNRMMFLLSSLCHDEGQLQRFLTADGAQILLDLYYAESAGKNDRDRLRQKITNFVLDHLAPPEIKNDDSLDESELDAEWTIINLRQVIENPPFVQDDAR